MDKRANNGGHKTNGGRKSKAEEEKVNQIFINALKLLYDVETDEEAKLNFVKDTLMDSQRGQIFIAEHIFGKPKETINQKVTIDNFNLKDVITFKE